MSLLQFRFALVSNLTCFWSVRADGFEFDFLFGYCRLPLCEIYRLRIGLTEVIMSFWWNDHRSPWEEKPVCGVERWKSLKQGHKP